MSDNKKEIAMYTRATSVEDAVRAVGEFRAGGTDIQERIRSHVTSSPLIDISSIPDLDRIAFSADGVSIGALATIADVGQHDQLQREYPALTLPARTIATPQIRNMSTIGGSLCQRTRCWYYRHSDFDCPKKGNATACPAREGNHHFGVCFDLGPCVHPHPSSIGCALLAYDAELMITGRGRVPIATFFGDGSDPTCDHQLKEGEMITHVCLPSAMEGELAAYHRQMSREWAEWPLVEVIVRLFMDARVVRDAFVSIGGVANIPFRLTQVEAALRGVVASRENLESAAGVSTSTASPLPQTEYKVQMVSASVLEALELALQA